MLTAVSGAGQTISANEMPVPAVLRVTDAVGHPMAGGAVTFYETLKQWTPVVRLREDALQRPHWPCRRYKQFLATMDS